MAEYQIITNYAENNLDPPWILKDTNLIDMAVGKLASLGSDQGLQLRAQTSVLQQQVRDIEALRDLMTKFTDANFVRFSIDTKTRTYKVEAPWEISALADSFPLRSIANAPSETIQKLIDFYKGINEELADVGSASRLAETHYRIAFSHVGSAAIQTDLVTKDNLKILNPTTGEAMYRDSYGSWVDIKLISKEPFAVPINSAEYQSWLQMAAEKRAEAINQLLGQYQLSPVSGDTILWKYAPGTGIDSTFLGNIPVVSSNREAETEVGRVVQYTDPTDTTATPKYYVISTPFSLVPFKVATYYEVVPVTPLAKPLIVSPTSDTLRDLRSRFSEASLQISQRNASQQLLVNSLLISYNYHFDAAANVPQAFNDLRSRLAGNI